MGLRKLVFSQARYISRISGIPGSDASFADEPTNQEEY